MIMMMRITATDENYPKTLLIRNSFGGIIWQIYHVENELEAWRLSANATENGFEDCELTDYMPEMEQTWEDWRETSIGIID